MGKVLSYDTRGLRVTIRSPRLGIRLSVLKAVYEKAPTFFKGIFPAVSFIAAVIGITTFLLTYLLKDEPLERAVYILSILLWIFLLVTLGSLGFALSQAPERRLLQHSHLLHQMGVKSSNAYIALSNPSLDNKHQALQELARSLRDVVDNFRALVWCIVNDRVVVSIKVRNITGDKFYTLCRNSHAIEDRPEGVAHTLGPINDNAEFAQIVGEGLPRQYHFISHDLGEDAAKGRYYNSDPHWRHKYLTTVTVPIFSKHFADSYVWGCLCVDAKKSGIFMKGEKVLLDLMKQQAALLLSVLYVFTTKWTTLE